MREYLFERIIRCLIDNGYSATEAIEKAQERIDSSMLSLEEDISNELEYILSYYKEEE